MITVIIKYREEITSKERELRFDGEVMEGLKMFQKLMELNCAVVEMEIKHYGKGTHVGSEPIG